MPTAKKQDDLTAVMEKIAVFKDNYKPLAERMHQIIMQAAPGLVPREWYGMPGYAKSKSTPVLLFFRADDYMTFGLTEKAHHAPDPNLPHKLMPSAWFFTELDDATEEKIAHIVKTAVS